MFCPQCGANQSEDLNFCKACGMNLQAVRQAASTSAPGEKLDWSKSWADASSCSKAELQRRRRRLGERHSNNNNTNTTPEARRYNEIRGGIITSCAGLGLMIFLYVFMQGIIVGGDVSTGAAAILSRLWIAGVFPFFVGMGLLINGLFVSKRLVETTGQGSQAGAESAGPAGSGKESEPRFLRAADTSEFVSSNFSITEETTKHLSGVGRKP
jgi:hypothetical protein